MIVAIIGTGLAGLACAGVLSGAGKRVVLFDKSKGYGGRMASRRRGDFAFDHGLPAFDPISEETTPALADLPLWGAHGRVAAPRMNAFPRVLGERYESRLDTPVVTIDSDGSTLTDATGQQHGGFTHVVVAIPGPQAAELLATHEETFGAAADATYIPGCTLMLAGASGAMREGERFRPANGPLAQIIRDDLKPGHPAGSPCWVAHARTDWAQANLERSKEDIASDLSAALQDALGANVADAEYIAGHRWRYSQIEQAIADPFLLSENGRIGACGDWCGADRAGGDARAAWRSGEALARAMVTASH